MPGGDAGAGGIPQPKTPEEAAALQQLLQQLGLTPDDLAKLQQAQPKMASEKDAYQARARAAILAKVAMIRQAQAASNTPNKDN
jgi:hypothetical protein